MISQLIKGLSVLVPGFLQRWVKVPYVLAQTGIPVGIAPACTVGANGALSGLTALPVIYSGGIWLYFGAGALFAGSPAGIYWCVMSSTTAGTAYNTTLTGWPKIPTSPTPIVAAGPGAYAGTTSEITLASFTVPANSIGINGSILQECEFSISNSANFKTCMARLGGILTGWAYISASVGLSAKTYIRAAGVSNRQVIKGVWNLYGTGVTPSYIAVNMAIDNLMAVTGQCANGTDYIIFNGGIFTVNP